MQAFLFPVGISNKMPICYEGWMESTPRIKATREGLGWTQDELAKRTGFTQAEISRWEKGTRTITNEQLAVLAKALKVTVAELFSNVNTRPEVPIVGYVGAGAEVYPHDDHSKGGGMETVEAPANVDHNKAVAVVVKGDSMEPFLLDGFLLFYDDRAYGVPEEWIGKMCVVKVADGPTLVKWVRRGSKPGMYKLNGVDSKHNAREAQIEWSAKVKTIVQR